MSIRKFQFPLQKALDWYRQVLAVEQAELQRILAAIQEVDQREKELLHAHNAEQHRVVGGPTCLGSDLQALAHYLNGLRDQMAQLMASKRGLEAKVAEQRKQVAFSHRRVRLLEKLEERRREDWAREASVQENLQASELFLAALVRDRAAIPGEAAE